MADPFTFFALLQKVSPSLHFPSPLSHPGSNPSSVRPSAMCQKCHIITRYDPDADGATEEQTNDRRLAWAEKK